MTPRKISVHQFGPASCVGDSAADTMLFVRRLLTDFGFNSEIFIDPGDGVVLPAPFRRASELRPRPQDLLLIHHGRCQERLDLLAGLNCRKALVYHGTSPPRCFPPDSRDRALAIKAYAQLAPLHGIVGAAIALSAHGARQLQQRRFADVATMPLFRDWSDLRMADWVDPTDPAAPPAFRIVNIGRIAADNYQRDLVRLAAAVPAIGGLPVELTLVGRGEPEPRYRAAVENDIARFGLADRVALVVGRAGEEVLAGYCRTANVCVSLSEGETGIASALPAMALDVPVVACAAPGTAEVLGDSGILVHGRDPGAVLEALTQLQRDRPFRRELIRRQRAIAGDARTDRLREDLRGWLVAHGVYRARGVLARLAGWRAARGRAREAVQPSAAAQYFVEPARGQTLADAEGQMATALARRPPPARPHRVVTIRCGQPPNSDGMLGDLRLVHVGEAATIAPSEAARWNLCADGVIAVSRVAARAVRNSGVALPIAVVGQGFDDIVPPSVVERRAALGPVGTAAPFTFLCLGGADAVSGFEEVLTAYCLAFSRDDPVLLVVSAPDDEDSAIDFWVKRLAGGSHSPSVQLVPEALTPAESELLYSLADAAILPIPGDGSSPAAPALAAGIPLIAARCGEHLDYCNAENTVLIDYTMEPRTTEAEGPRVRLSVPELMAAMQAVYRGGRDPDAAPAERARRGQADLARLRWSGVAESIDAFVDLLDHRPVMSRKIRLAWVSTYNSRCGLATHSEHLLEHFNREVYDITVIGNHQEPLKPDPANVVRLWPDRSGSLASVRDFIRTFDAVFVNFHFSLMEIHDLAALLNTAQLAGIDTFVTLHKTVDTVIDGRKVSLAEIAAPLRACTRLIVHTEADVARLKDFGVADNVVMIPPGVIDRPALNATVVRNLLGLQGFQPIVGTFGFLLPPKGLQQLIHAFAIVLRHFPEAMLLMLNAEFPGAAESGEERDRCRALIRGLGLEDRIRLIDEFLETDEILLLLNACDTTVFTYQDSSESDSGAVRLGLAAGRPVATTPLPVFANLKGVVHQLAGAAAADIAEGIMALLADPARAAAIVGRQREWIADNSWAAQAARIGNIIRGCFEERYGVELQPPASPLPSPDLAGADGETAGAAGVLREMIGLADAIPEDRPARRAQ